MNSLARTASLAATILARLQLCDLIAAAKEAVRDRLARLSCGRTPVELCSHRRHVDTAHASPWSVVHGLPAGHPFTLKRGDLGLGLRNLGHGRHGLVLGQGRHGLRLRRHLLSALSSRRIRVVLTVCL